jgi:hypothetical protein
MKKTGKKKPIKPRIKTTSGEPEAKKMANGAARPKGSRNKPRAPGPERIERKRYTTKLPCPIAPEIVVMRADEQAKTWREREKLMAENRERNTEFREQRAHLDKKLGELATSVAQHTEVRDVEVVEYLVSGTGNIKVERQDTMEVVETKAASKDDLQESIFSKIDKANAQQETTVAFTKAAGDRLRADANARRNNPIADGIAADDGKRLPGFWEIETLGDDEDLDWSVDPNNPDTAKLSAAELDARRRKLAADRADRADGQ